MIKKLIKKIQFKINAKHKDRLFCLIFGKEKYKKYALSLYNAINGTSYENEDELEIYTLSDAIYIKMKNDVAYLVQDTIALYEQQSTINPNMPIRSLMYISELYSKYITTNGYNIYGKTLIPLPKPQCVVFYNGEENYPDTKLRLSDSYIGASEEEKADYEWTTSVYNITDKNSVIRNRCKVLNEYMIFVEKVRKYSKMVVIEEAVDLAVDECIKEGILKDVLLSQRAEVKKMCITEFDEKIFVKGIHEEGREEGREEGMKMLENAIILLRSGKEVEDLQKMGYSKNIIETAYKLK